MSTSRQQERARPDIETVLGLGKTQTSVWRRHWRLLTAAGVVAVLLALVLLWGGGGNRGRLRYTTEPATRTDLTVIVTATGTVQPTNEVEVSSELSGTVRSVLVDYNSRVTAGQTLAELDTDKLKATVEASRAKVAAAEAKVVEANATVNEKERDFQRKSGLATRKITSGLDLEAAQAAYERAVAAVASAKADVASAKADLKLNETNLSKARIFSPINGVVLSRKVEPGQTVAANLQAPVLFTLAEDLTKMEVRVDVDEADVGKVKEGQSAAFTVDAYPDRTFNARISVLRYGSETVQGVVTYKAVLATNNGDLLLRPGMTATAEITVQQVKDAITVPNAALRYSPPVAAAADNRSFLQRLLPGPPRLRAVSGPAPTGPVRKIWILDRSVAKEVPVTIGSTDGKRTQIVKGDIGPGQAVIVDATTRAK